MFLARTVPVSASTLSCKHVKTERHICKIVKVFPVYIMKQIRNWGIVNTQPSWKIETVPQLPIVEDHWHEPCIILDSSVMSPQWKICHCQKDLILSCFENLPVDTVPVGLLHFCAQKYISFLRWGEKGIEVNNNKYGWYIVKPWMTLGGVSLNICILNQFSSFVIEFWWFAVCPFLSMCYHLFTTEFSNVVPDRRRRSRSMGVHFELERSPLRCQTVRRM